MHKIESHFLVASKEVINIINNIYYVVRLVSSLQLLVKYEVLLIFRQRSFLSLDLSFIFSLIFDSTTTLVFIILCMLGSPAFRSPYRKLGRQWGGPHDQREDGAAT